MIDTNSNILIIGGTGTIGKNLTSQLLSENPNRSISIYSRDEIKQLEMMLEFQETSFPNLEFIIGDIRDSVRLKETTKGKQIVVNAAALKHVVIAENNPGECHKTNVVGTKNLIEACVTNKVKKCILISTDKAIDPKGIYGNSKKESEDLVKGSNGESETIFSVIRFGNILGSRASVSEIFKKMSGSGSLTITDKDATRFGITIKDAINYLIEKLDAMRGGEIFTPSMKAFKVIDLAKVIAPNSTLEFIGLRPGDKLHEVIEDDNGNKIYSNNVDSMDEMELRNALNAVSTFEDT